MMLVRVMATAAVLRGARGAACPDDPESDLCGSEEVNGAMHIRGSLWPILLLSGAVSSRSAFFVLPFLGAPLAAGAATGAAVTPGTCGAIKDMYKKQNCCGDPAKQVDYVVTAKPTKKLFANVANPCNGKKPVDGPTAGDKYFNNIDCDLVGVEQAGANVTKGYQGSFTANRVPILTSYLEAGMCPVNVHWHLGTEHYSKGEYDENGKGPAHAVQPDPFGQQSSRRLAAAQTARLGFRCHLYDSKDPRFGNTSYKWQHCHDMYVGETYEVHWPHSAAGACGTIHQYQTPFYDGVFCKENIINLDPLNTWQKIGVQSQIYTIINDENYYYPDLLRGMIIEGDYGKDVAKYTGSTTGTSRNNNICSRYAPITWQVDRKCHLISASSFDKLCADMKAQQDDMSADLHAHGSRILVLSKYAANNMQRLRRV